MAADTYGTAHLHGIDTVISNMTITSIDLEKGFAVNQKTAGQDGRPIEHRLDGKTITGSITGFIRTGFTNWVQGAVITLADLEDTALNDDYVIVSVGEAHKAGEKIEITINIENDEAIDYTP
jgi:hypothetical protein